jgi:hypothetical protein
LLGELPDDLDQILVEIQSRSHKPYFKSRIIEGTDQRGYHRRISQEANGLAVAESHRPADHEYGDQKATETVSAVIEALFIGLFGSDSHYYRCEQREKKCRFEMRKIDFRH